MKNKQFMQILKELNACSEAVEWAQQFKTWKTLWKNCERGDWMLWIIGKYSGKLFSEERKPLVLAACECARLALKHISKGEERPKKSIKTAERWAKGENVSKEEVRTAAYAAANAADAADAAYTAAYAAYTAAYAADAADAAYTAAYAAYAAYAANAAKKETLNKCADIVRKHFPDFEPSEKILNA